jgi:hypothetical protein
MVAVLAGICFKSSNTICPAGSKVIDPIQALVGGFVAVGLLGIIWLMIRGRRG